ncbi:M23 family metallopeptidase [Curtobacterium sp. MCSS17_005]|uniref:M23 family metallopeptidase n=1 Tax=Curtobacterium sp. MCSS17_005 TaxID=2175641 RepID=UPI0015E88B83|nr:M23 family metallopeptidase [Curtobacterium sp. MCSS17_005]WIB32804.1 M23 family metallopeptidase [Curtobacterium sp. MCSS17_005]
MTIAPELDQHPETPVVHLSRRAALEAERAAARGSQRRSKAAPVAKAAKPEKPAEAAKVAKPAKATKPAKAPKAAKVAKPVKAVVLATASSATEPAGRRSAAARATTEHVDDRIQRVVRRPAPKVTRVASAPRASRSARAGRITLTSAAAAIAMFAASAMPAHASAGTSMATSTIAPIVRTQDYAVTQAVTAAGFDRDGFTVGGGSTVTTKTAGSTDTAATAGGAVSFGGAVRSPFPGPVQMSSGFGYRSAPCGACSSLHQGLDFTPGMGTPIGAVAAGEVRVSGTYFSYGNAVIIDHVVDGRQVSTLYGHMIPGSSPLKVGDTVAAGQFIGLVGSSGVSTGAHLHLEVLMDGVTPIDPKAWLEARIGRSLTL